jgi:hypothetical protein
MAEAESISGAQYLPRLVSGHLSHRFEDRDKPCTGILECLHTMAAQTFEGKEASEDLGQPLRRQSDRSPAVLLHQYLELALEHLDPSVYQIRLGAHCDTPAISGNRG